MKIALIQQHAGRNVEDNIQRGLDAVREAAQNGAEVIAFAELAFLPFLPQKPAGQDFASMADTVPGSITGRFSSLAREYGVVLVLNLFEQSGERTFDSSPVIDADGSLLGVTRMVHIMDGMGFYEKGYYSPGDRTDFVYETQKGRIGVAICYDRHFPEYMRNLGLLEAELVIVPQAGAMGEWPSGIFEAELRVASFQNGYFSALVNRVGKEEHLHFSGESFVTDPTGQVIARASKGKDAILYADCDFRKIVQSPAKSYFMRDRRPDFYEHFRLTDPMAHLKKRNESL